MKLSKNTFLPFMGLTVLALLIVLSYVQGAIFLDKILICSVILSVVFIGKIKDSLQDEKLDSSYTPNKIRSNERKH